MSVEPVQLDLDAARAARDEALDSVESAVDPAFADYALDAIHECALERATFTADDVWEALTTEMPAERRAMGAIMRTARRLGWIEPTERFAQCRRPSRHAAMVRVWKSRINPTNRSVS